MTRNSTKVAVVVGRVAAYLMVAGGSAFAVGMLLEPVVPGYRRSLADCYFLDTTRGVVETTAFTWWCGRISDAIALPGLIIAVATAILLAVLSRLRIARSHASEASMLFVWIFLAMLALLFAVFLKGPITAVL